MNINIRECRKFQGTYSFDYIASLELGYMLPVRVGNRYCIIVSTNEIPKVYSITVVEKADKPLYKQHMDLMMGRRPTQNINRATYRPVYIRPEIVGKYRYYIYEIAD